MSRAKARGFSRRASKSACAGASRKVSSLVGLPAASSPRRTKSRVLVTRTSRYLFQYLLTWSLSAVSHASSEAGLTSTTPQSGSWPSRGFPRCICLAE